MTATDLTLPKSLTFGDVGRACKKCIIFPGGTYAESAEKRAAKAKGESYPPNPMTTLDAEAMGLLAVFAAVGAILGAAVVYKDTQPLTSQLPTIVEGALVGAAAGPWVLANVLFTVCGACVDTGTLYRKAARAFTFDRLAAGTNKLAQTPIRDTGKLLKAAIHNRRSHKKYDR